MKLDPKFNIIHPSRTLTGTPASVKQQMWDLTHKIFFVYNGEHYYIDKRYESPFGYEYDIWYYYGNMQLQSRVHYPDLVKRLITYINRSRKLKRILGKID